MFGAVCCKDEYPLLAWSNLLRDVPLDDTSREIANIRIGQRARALRKRVSRLLMAYRISKITVTAGALLVPSITGLDESKSQPSTTFWLIWSLSLLTAGGNALISLFGIDRKYFLLKERSARLEEEAWLYVSLSGKYHTGASHQDQFSFFVEHCEALLSIGHKPKTDFQPQTPKTVAMANRSSDDDESSSRVD